MLARALCWKCCSSARRDASLFERYCLKYAVVILVILLGVWIWRRNRAEAVADLDEPSAKAPEDRAAIVPQIMLSCAVCGVHLPKSDALVGKKGSYCSAAHRQQRET
jgi:uncharacterized protein